MHGTETLPVTDFQSCEGYFCEAHLTIEEIEGEAVQLCLSCAQRAEAEGVTGNGVDIEAWAS
jgi:hypothetical protein